MPTSSRSQLFDKDLLRLWLDTPSDPANIFGIHHPSPDTPSLSPGAILHHDGHIIGLDLHRKHNRQQWKSLTQYRSCTLKNETIHPGDCVLVRHELVEREYAARKSRDPSLSFWKALVLEIRALDPEHVYVLVSWFDRPIDDGRSASQGLQWGKYELVASTEVDVVTAKAVQCKVRIRYGQGTGKRYYWRMAFDFAEKRLIMQDEVHTLCRCEARGDDKPVMQCEACRRWMHIHCAKRNEIEREDAGVGAQETRRDSAVAEGSIKGVSRSVTPTVIPERSTGRGKCVHCHTSVDGGA